MYSAEDYKRILNVTAAAANEMAAGRMKPTPDQLERIETDRAPDSQLPLDLDDEE